MNTQISSYHDEIDLNNNKKLETLLKELPPYCADFFRGTELIHLPEPELLMLMI